MIDRASVLIPLSLLLLGPADASAQTPPDSAAQDMSMPMGSDSAGAANSWRMPPMYFDMPMPPQLMELEPAVDPFLPIQNVDDRSSVPEAIPHKIRALSDGDTLRLEAQRVKRTIKGRTFVMFGFNKQYPGPLIKVPKDASITILYKNNIELPSTIHWHGVRLDNRFDGVPYITQEPVPPGGTFVYKVEFPDAGIYWYHPHVRSDIQLDLGLYGNILVQPAKSDYYNPVNRQEVLILDDLLIDEAGLFPYGTERATHTLMGRFGNVLLVNGEAAWRTEVKQGAVIRFFLTNVSNTRTFNVSFGNARIKVVGADIGKYVREEYVESVVIAPAQRYIVEVLFANAGTVVFTNRIQAINHYRGTFVPQVDTLGLIVVRDESVEQSYAATFDELRTNERIAAGIDQYRPYFDDPIEHELVLTIRTDGLPLPVLAMMRMDTFYIPPMEWNDAMPMMNYVSTGKNVTWILREPETGRENMEIHWKFREGEVVKIRIRNDPNSIHPMQHPIHLHGQRFLVLTRDGVPNDNLVWRDTALVPVGSTIVILLDASNPGDWLLHCHISEHIESGMKMLFTVVSNTDNPVSSAHSTSGSSHSSHHANSQHHQN